MLSLNKKVCFKNKNASSDSHVKIKDSLYIQLTIYLGYIKYLSILKSYNVLLHKLQIKLQATTGFQAFIVHYREDPDQQNLIDWIQEDWVSKQSSSLFVQSFIKITNIVFK